MMYRLKSLEELKAEFSEEWPFHGTHWVPAMNENAGKFFEIARWQKDSIMGWMFFQVGRYNYHEDWFEPVLVDCLEVFNVL